MTEQMLLKNIMDEIIIICNEYRDNNPLIDKLKSVKYKLTYLNALKLNENNPSQTKTEKDNEPIFIDINVIIRTVSRYYKVDNLIHCKSRKGKITLARQITHYFLHKYTLLKEKDIGRMVGGKHRLTVIHSIKTVQNYIEYNKKIRGDIEYLESLILSLNHSEMRTIKIQTLIDNLPGNPYEPIELDDIDVSMNIKTQYDDNDRKVVDYITYDIYTKDGKEILNFDVELNPGKERELFCEIENRIN